MYKDYLSVLRKLDNNTNRFGMVEYDIQKALDFAKKCIISPKVGDHWSIEMHKERGNAYMNFKQAIENRDTTLQWYDWYQLASKISPGLGSVDIIATAYEHISPRP